MNIKISTKLAIAAFLLSLANYSDAQWYNSIDQQSQNAEMRRQQESAIRYQQQLQQQQNFLYQQQLQAEETRRRFMHGNRNDGMYVQPQINIYGNRR